MANYSKLGTELAENVGKILAESAYLDNNVEAQEFMTSKLGITVKEGFKGERLTEAVKGIREGTLKEDLTLSNSNGAYTTLLAKTLFSKAYDGLKDKILDLVIELDDMKNAQGFGAYQIALGLPTNAVEVSDGQVVKYFDEGVSEVTVVPKQIAVGTAITWRMVKRGMPSYMKWVMNNAVNAITRKIGSDVVSGLSAGAGDSQTGFGTSAYDAIIDAQSKLESATYSTSSIPYGFEATDLVLSPITYATLRKDADWKSHVYYATAVPGKDVVVARPVEYFGSMKILSTPFLTGTTLGLVMDRNYAMAYVPESDVETFEGNLPGRPFDREIVLTCSYGLVVLYPKAIVKILN